jgi:hypothetical protein
MGRIDRRFILSIRVSINPEECVINALLMYGEKMSKLIKKRVSLLSI